MEQSFQSHIEKFEGKLWGLHFKVPFEVAQSFLDAGKKRVVVRIGVYAPFQAGIMFLKSDERFINVNQKFCKANGLLEGSKINVTITPDESKYGMEMPEELEAALEMSTSANDLFHKLTAGNMRNLIYFCNQTKSSEIRTRRAWVVCKHLENHAGIVDFKVLNAEIKEANALAKLKNI